MDYSDNFYRYFLVIIHLGHGGDIRMIELTSTFDKKSVHVNSKRIRYFTSVRVKAKIDGGWLFFATSGRQGTLCTMISFSNDDFLFVDETPDEVYQMIRAVC